MQPAQGGGHRLILFGYDIIWLTINLELNVVLAENLSILTSPSFVFLFSFSDSPI